MLRFESQIQRGVRGDVAPDSPRLRERRSAKARELRAETKDGKQYLAGYAATYNTLSDDLGWGVHERIIPGAFSRAVKEKQDVRHLINHDPTLVLGRTKAGTTELTDDGKGLAFRTLINPDDPVAVSLLSKVERGDIDECSFGFYAVRTAWIEEQDPDDPKGVPRCIRELHDVDLFDISTVTYPAYPGTNTAAERALRADGSTVPVEIRTRMTRDAADGECGCRCPECLDGDCGDCSNAECDDPNCTCMRGARAAKKKTKRVDSEDLTYDCFLIVGDPEDPATWKLPVKFSTEEKTQEHLKNALARFNQLKGVSEEDKKAAWSELVKLCKEHGIEVSEESSLRARLTPEQVWDLRRDAETERARVVARAVQASL